MSRRRDRETEREEQRTSVGGHDPASAEQDRAGAGGRAILWANVGCSRHVKAEKSDTVTAVLQEGLSPQAKSSPLQTYLILLHSTNAAFLNKSKVYGNPPQGLYQRHFPTSICSLHVSVSHFGNSHNTSNF